MHQGKVKWFNKTKGYGFITTHDREVFFHKSQLNTQIESGQEVEFDLYETDSERFEARNIHAL